MKVWLQDQITTLTPIVGRLRLFVLWGQSHVMGAGFRSDTGETDWPQDGRPVAGCYIWDKYARLNWNDATLVDANRSGEAHEFKPLTMGFGGEYIVEGTPVNRYPWESFPEETTIGPEVQLAYDVRRITGDSVLIVKFAVSGTQVTNQPFACWNVAKTGSDSYIETLLDAYWAPALTAAIAMAGGDKSKVVLGGIASMIGFSDSRYETDANAYEADYTATIAAIRARIDADTGGNVPYLVCKTPRYADGSGNALAYIEQVRASQEAIGDAITNGGWIETQGLVDRTTDIHGTGRRNCWLGSRIARWALQQTPVEVTA